MLTNIAERREHFKTVVIMMEQGTPGEGTEGQSSALAIGIVDAGQQAGIILSLLTLYHLVGGNSDQDRKLYLYGRKTPFTPPRYFHAHDEVGNIFVIAE
jgi:hypothetical protein